jgi:biotin carboxyl carrier protein
MAELSERPTREQAVDARAVRARLASPAHPGEEDHLRVAPVAPPLRMSNPSVGVGPLGGALLPPVHRDEPAVLAQRHVLVDGQPEDIVLEERGHDRHVLREDGVDHRVVLEPGRAGPGGAFVREVLVDGFRLEVEVTSERLASLRERASRGRAAAGATGPLVIKAIIPGKVATVSVEVGETVSAGQQLLVVEAMKMQNELRAPRDGTIERVGVAPGVNIEVGDLLVVIS